MDVPFPGTLFSGSIEFVCSRHQINKNCGISPELLSVARKTCESITKPSRYHAVQRNLSQARCFCKIRLPSPKKKKPSSYGRGDIDVDLQWDPSSGWSYGSVCQAAISSAYHHAMGISYFSNGCFLLET